MYQFAAEWPSYARRIAANQEYQHTGTHVKPYPRTHYAGRTCCPIGVMFLVAAEQNAISVPTDGAFSTVPDAELTIQFMEWSRLHADQPSIRAFIQDWDSGRIEDLAEALGVE